MFMIFFAEGEIIIFGHFFEGNCLLGDIVVGKNIFFI